MIVLFLVISLFCSTCTAMEKKPEQGMSCEEFERQVQELEQEVTEHSHEELCDRIRQAKKQLEKFKKPRSPWKILLMTGCVVMGGYLVLYDLAEQTYCKSLLRRYVFGGQNGFACGDPF